MNESAYDVVIVGGGPAGSMAAKSAAEKGAKVLLIERDPNIGLPVRCGEGVSVKNVSRFVKIDKRWIAAEIGGMVMYSPDGSEVPVSDKDQLGVILERSLFDRYLAELAADAGADIITRADVEGLIINDGVVQGVHYRRFGKSYAQHAKVVIGADGVESRIGRWAGIRTQIAAKDLESGYQKLLTGIDYDHKNCHFYFGNEIAPGGYLWIFPKGERTASVGLGAVVSRSYPGEPRRKLDEFIKHRFGNPAVIGEVAGGIPVALPLKKPFTDGLILAGDAARHCNPLTGGGIYTAMVSGFNAGEVAADAVARNDLSVGFLKQFNKRIDKDILVVHKRAHKLAYAVSKLTDDNFNRTAHEILSIPPDQRTLRNIFLKGLVSQPKLVVEILKAFL